MRLTLIAILLALGACSQTPAAVDSFCALLQRTDFTDRGIRGLNRHNKQALDVNENTANRLKCPR